MRLLQLLSTAFSEAFHALKAKPLHTILSLLGIIIGVGALISILALGDGMEKFGRDQIATTTDLDAIQITVNTYSTVDGIRMEKQVVPSFQLNDYDSLKKIVNNKAAIKWMSVSRHWVSMMSDTIKRPTILLATYSGFFEKGDTLLYGNNMSEKQISNHDSIVIINLSLAKKITTDTSKLESLLGQSLIIQNRRFSIIGIMQSTRDKSGLSGLVIPLTALSPEQLKAYNTSIIANVYNIEDLAAIQENIEHYFSRAPRSKDDFRVLSNEFRVDQLRRGIFLFKAIMGLIVGISILVGGIGIMNVLLMSVTERTREIGIRKALGAKPKEIAMQFMAEAMTISLIGSLLGILFGMLTLAIALPIIKAVLKGDIIHISYQASSILVILIIALVIGLVFGTYPAYKAAKQSPIDAIRVE